MVQLSEKHKENIALEIVEWNGRFATTTASRLVDGVVVDVGSVSSSTPVSSSGIPVSFDECAERSWRS